MRWLIVCLLTLLTVMSGAWLLGPSLRARYLFNEVAGLQLGRSTSEDAERLARKIHAEPYGDCDRLRCRMGGDGRQCTVSSMVAGLRRDVQSVVFGEGLDRGAEEHGVRHRYG